MDAHGLNYNHALAESISWLLFGWSTSIPLAGALLLALRQHCSGEI
ncbi:hypothetical protein RchiOBHm_Chr4g0407741 [Rosa chinensis]|uniref:Uncharacterized protein n=1 Tax=Rosa chinensis TaxID=74649 RepID=A0A2P6QUN6_ROSCH|nr:hypothetical protein RchiOBHm_Chr4g0407741 [Rosa chinensis]